MASTIRSFIAIEIPRDVRATLAGLIRQLARQWPEYRWVEPEHFHLTLNFLGNVPDEKLLDVCNIVRNTAAKLEPFSMELGDLGAFPKPARPRVIWAGVREGRSPLSRLYYDLAEDLEVLRLERDRKAFKPHVTLGRIRDGQRWPDAAIERLENEPTVDIGTVDVDELVLFSSHLEKTGPEYTVMDRAKLGN